MLTYLNALLLVVGLSLSNSIYSTPAQAKEGDSDIWPPSVDSWRTHQGNTYEFSTYPPISEGQACYRTVFFGDSICAGYDNENIFHTIRSFCENMAIRFSI